MSEICQRLPGNVNEKETAMNPCVYIVHCIDTEGPLYESLTATFERLSHIFHLDFAPNRETLRKLQEGKIDLGDLTKEVQAVLAPNLLDYNDTWHKLDQMLGRALSREFRRKHLDSEGNGWVYNWFCVDHVEYQVNPRRRDIGYHNIFDHYREILTETNSVADGLHFHFHPQPFLKHAHLCATHWWASSNALYQILSRRIIDRHWFPSTNRPGFQVNRPDSHWFLEQYMPFDYASLAMTAESSAPKQFDFSEGRSGDWRRAPVTWSPYNPSHDDYQRPGTCRRWIGRCLNIGTRIYNISENDIRQAFAEAGDGKPVVLSFANHDYRDITRDVDWVRRTIEEVSKEFPGVPYKYSEAATAMREALGLGRSAPCKFEVSLRSMGTDAHVLDIRSETPTFGSQPYFCFKTVTQDYYHDNLDFHEPFHHWTYVFDEETFPIRAIDTIGVAANNSTGDTTVVTYDCFSGEFKQSVL